MYQALCKEPETQEMRNMDTSMLPGCCFSTRRQLSVTMGFTCTQGEAVMSGFDPERVGTGVTWTRGRGGIPETAAPVPGAMDLEAESE